MDGSTAESSHSERSAPRRASHVLRALRYLGRRALALAVSVVVTVYLAILVVNLGGYLDTVISAEIDLAVGMSVQSGWLRNLSPEARTAQILATTEAMKDAAGLNQPLVVRSARWLSRALSLRWGDSSLRAVYIQGRTTRAIRDLILDALPRTLLLFGLANLAVFLAAVALALPLSRTQGGPIDRAIAVLSPLSAGPPWIYGILLTVAVFQVPMLRPLTGHLTAWPRELTWPYVLLVLQVMVLPVLSVICSKLIQTTNQWRTYFGLYRTENYVELAQAAGLPQTTIERRFVLRPALPAVLTQLALLLTALWQEVIILEYFFRLGGVGQLFIRALLAHDVPTTLALVVLFAYLLAITLLILEIVVALVDPRVRLSGGDASARPARSSRRRWVRGWSLAGIGLWVRQQRTRLVLPWVSLWQAAHRMAAGLWGGLRNAGRSMREVVRQPAAIVGLVGIAGLVALAVYAIVSLPYAVAVTRWRGVQYEDYRRPENALPVWVDWFNSDRMARTVLVDSRLGQAARSETAGSGTTRQVLLSFPIDIEYDRYPQDVAVYYHTNATKKPFVSLTWVKPDGEEMSLPGGSVDGSTFLRVAIDSTLKRKLGTDHPEQALFTTTAKPDELTPGRYTLQLTATLFAPEDTLDAEVIAYGEVYGAAGTDGRRRDLMTAVLWGTPVALAFGVLAALGSTLAAAVIAAAAAWYGGLLDSLVQRVSEINMVLPTMAVSLMFYTLYSKSFWVILSVTVALSIFGNGMRTYRAALQQTVDAPWVEAARTQGASGMRIVWRYLLAHLAPMMVPQMVTLVPTYVFLEAALSFLGMSDPSLPTWGVLVREAFAGDVYGGVYHLVLVPAILLAVMALSFGLLGRSLERVLNPRLRES